MTEPIIDPSRTQIGYGADSVATISTNWARVPPAAVAATSAS